MSFDTQQFQMMRRALDLAARGRGRVEPNPLVGAVVVAGEKVLGEGWHAQFGGPHAEVVALEAAGERAAGATLYVTLEPCCHHGKTPPCTDRVLASKVARVVVAMSDPFPEVAGRGIERLRAAGMHVDLGLLEAEARQLNAPYLKLLRAGRPYVHAKWAMSLDGKIATHTGDSKWITGEAARAHAHQFRGLVDAIIVGSGTVAIDDPLLTARPPGPRVATRVILDSAARIPLGCHVVRTAREVPTILATTSRATASAAAIDRFEKLIGAGCQCLVLPEDQAGRVSITALLDDFGRRRWTNVLVEGGSSVLAAFLDAGEIDAVRAYVAPTLIGGRAARSATLGVGIATMSEAFRLIPAPPISLGADFFLEAHRLVPGSEPATTARKQ